MSQKSISIPYPRKRLARGLLRSLGRIILPIAFNLKINGWENFPQKGPLIVVGNHTAVMEAVLLAIYTPWQVEMLGAADIPHERISQIFSDAYGFIPTQRGHIDRSALQAALGILDQGGVVGIFPEGGIWNPGLMPAQTGVAWLSFRGKSPVLPIGFSGTSGALEQALRIKRPHLGIQVGQLIPPIEVTTVMPRKAGFEAYSEHVMTRVRDLLLPDDPSFKVKIKDERFELRIELRDPQDVLQDFPDALAIQHNKALAKFLHRPAILKIFKINLKLPIDALQNLESEHNPVSISEAVQAVLNYLNYENPYLLSYRFGPKTAEAMLKGLMELSALSKYAAVKGLTMIVTPIRQFYSLEQEQEIIQIKQDAFEHWM